MPLVTVDDVISDWLTSGTHDHEWICIRIPDTARSYLCPRADLPFLQLNSTGSVARVNPRFQNEHKNHHTHSDESQSDNNARHNHRLPTDCKTYPHIVLAFSATRFAGAQRCRTPSRPPCLAPSKRVDDKASRARQMGPHKRQDRPDSDALPFLSPMVYSYITMETAFYTEAEHERMHAHKGDCRPAHAAQQTAITFHPKARDANASPDHIIFVFARRTRGYVHTTITSTYRLIVIKRCGAQSPLPF